MSVDGWLALTSSGMYRLFAADDVRKFMGSGDFEVVMAEFVETWGRRVHVPHLGVVQVMPRARTRAAVGAHRARPCPRT
jgi:hypothetical protein